MTVTDEGPDVSDRALGATHHAPRRKPGLLARLLDRWWAGRGRQVAVDPEPGFRPEREPEPEPGFRSEPEPEGEPEPAEAPAPQASALVGALESLGRAHHRPYSRA